MPIARSRSRRLALSASSQQGLARALERAHLTVAGLAVVGFAVAGWIVARAIGSRSLYLLVYAGVLVMGVSAAAARRKLAIAVERSNLPARVREGQSVAVILSIEAKRRATTIIVEDRLDPALGETSRLPIPSIGVGEAVEHSYSFAPNRRGVYDLGPVSATWSDPFGLTTQAQELAPTTPIIVHPRVEVVHDRVLTRMWEDPPIRPPVSKPWPTGFEFYGMRDYVPGDDLRRVVWTAVAKTGRMMVRESEQGISDRVCIFVDTSREWHQPGDPSPTFEAGVRVAASLCARHISDGFAVSLHTNDVALESSVRGPRARFTLLDHLARVQQSATPMGNVGSRLLGDSRRGAHFVVISPHLDRAVTDQLRLVIQRGASVALVKLVWEESDPLSWAHAAELGCQVIQVGADGSLEAAFSAQLRRSGAR
jgi:uncharacterized protein (DUF58 family)